MKIKTIRIIAFLLMLLLAMSTFVGCVNEEDTPTGEEETTEAPTEAETTLADIPAADALNQLMANLSGELPSEEESVENLMFDLDMTMGISMSMDGMQNTTTLPLRITVTVDGEDLQFDGDVMGTSVAHMIYKDGILYISADDEEMGLGKIKCTMTPEEFEIVSGVIFGTENDVDEDDLTVPELPGIKDLKPAELFASVTSQADEANGHLIITCKGFNTALATELAPLLQPMLEGLGLVGGGEWDENGELITDPAATLAEVVEMLSSFNEDTFAISFTFDQTGKLVTTGMDMTLRVTESDGYTESVSEVSLKGNFVFKIGGQTVSAPADADEYVEENWRVIFDMETAEMLELVADANGNITLSDDPALRERQILYLYNHSEEFAGNLFNLKGFLVDTYVVDEETATRPVDVGAFEGMISLRDPSVEEDYTTVLSFQIPASMKGDGYPAEGTLIEVRNAKLEIIADSDWGSYMYLLITDYSV